MPFYTIHRGDVPLPALSGRVFDPEAEPFCRGNAAAIDRYPWGGDYRPEALARVTWTDAGLRVLLWAREARVSARVKRFNGDVWTDSCLEFFLQPFEADPRYLNIEVNAAGAALIGIGAGREGRALLDACPPGMGIRASRHDGGWWAVGYELPFPVIEALFGRPVTPQAPMRGNFYKCDESIHPHFGCWSPVEAPAPDFHRPECFGLLGLSQARQPV